MLVALARGTNRLQGLACPPLPQLLWQLRLDIRKVEPGLVAHCRAGPATDCRCAHLVAVGAEVQAHRIGRHALQQLCGLHGMAAQQA